MKWTGAACALIAASAAAAQDLPPPVEQTCRDAHWELVTDDVRPGGVVVSGRARVDRRCFADGRVGVQEFRYLAPNGDVVFRGATFAIWNEDRSLGDILWLMVGDPGHSFLKGSWSDGVLLQRGPGADAGGAYLEHSVTDFNGVGDSTFRLYRSYDDGSTWVTPFTHAVWYATPSPPAAYPDGLIDALGSVELADGLTPFLDGFAAFEILSDSDRDPAGVRFARPIGADLSVWRTSAWRIGDAALANEDAPIGPAE